MVFRLFCPMDVFVWMQHGRNLKPKYPPMWDYKGNLNLSKPPMYACVYICLPQTDVDEFICLLLILNCKIYYAVST